MKTIDAETLRKIEAALENWESVDPLVREPVDIRVKGAKVVAEKIIEAIGESERLSEDDLTIGINTMWLGLWLVLVVVLAGCSITGYNSMTGTLVIAPDGTRTWTTIAPARIVNAQILQSEKIASISTAQGDSLNGLDKGVDPQASKIIGEAAATAADIGLAKLGIKAPADLLQAIAAQTASTATSVMAKGNGIQGTIGGFTFGYQTPTTQPSKP